jgi:hypothetical protein
VNSIKLRRQRVCKVDNSIGPSDNRLMTRMRAASVYPFTVSEGLGRLLPPSEKRKVKASRDSKTSESRVSNVMVKDSRSKSGNGWQSQYRRYNSAAATISSHGGSIFVLATSAQDWLDVDDNGYLLGNCDIPSLGEEIIFGIASLGTD